jgi:hypothetical protein
MQGLVVSNMVGASMGAHRDLIGAFADLLEQQRTTPPGSAAAHPSVDPSPVQDT